MAEPPMVTRRDFLKGIAALGASALLPFRYKPPHLPPVTVRATALAALPPVEDDLECAFDPCKLAERVGIVPDPWQSDFLRSTDQEVLLNCSRQSGKSTTTSILAAHTAIYRPGSLILLLSPSLRQSGQLFAKVKWTLKRLGGDFADITTDNALSVKLANGSEIHSLPGKAGTVRGFSAVTLLIIDEAAFVEDALYQAVRPMLAVSAGRLALLSTPFGKRGFFHEEWANGGPGWRRFAVPAEECPRIPAEFLAKERRSLGPLYEQEYRNAFLDIVTALFRHEDIERALDNDLTPYFDDESEVAK